MFLGFFVWETKLVAVKSILCGAKYLWLVMDKFVVMVHLLNWQNPQVAQPAQKTAKFLWHSRRITLQKFFQYWTQSRLNYKFDFFVKTLNFGQNFYFWSKFLFLVDILICGPNFDFWSKFLFLVDILIFGPNF